MKYFKGCLEVLGISPASFRLLRVTVCVCGEEGVAGVNAGLVPRLHLGPHSGPERRWPAGWGRQHRIGVTTLQLTSQGICNIHNHYSQRVVKCLLILSNPSKWQINICQ